MRAVWKVSVIVSILIIGIAGTSVFAVVITEDTKLTPSDGFQGNGFGERSLSSSADRIVVGALRDNDNGLLSGSAYVFDLVDGSWVETKLVASDGAATDLFGISVSVDGDRIAVGAIGDNDKGLASGSAYVYDFDEVDWVETKLSASDGAKFDFFGASTSVSGDRIVVGGHGVDNGGFSTGAAYVYDFNGAIWDETKLIPSDGRPSQNFGISVSVDGDRIAVGASGDRINDEDRSGSAYVFDLVDGEWVETKITASDAAAGDNFGETISLSGDRIVVSANFDDTDKGLASGSAYIFDLVDGSWVETKLVASDGAAKDLFGTQVSIFGDKIIVGAPSKDDGTGSAYVFDLVDGSWVESKLTTSDEESQRTFGLVVSVSEDRSIASENSNFKEEGASIYLFEHDSDEDGITNGLDNCPKISNPGQEDFDKDGVGDACNDADDPDGDEISNALDNCPGVSNEFQEDTDEDGVGDACNDADDIDGDEYSNALDNCPGISNPDQTDSNSNGVGDACEGPSLLDILLSGEITICHNDKKTITVSLAAFGKHFLHGDAIGPCE